MVVEESRTHVAILPSLRAIDIAGGSDLEITSIEGHYSIAQLRTLMNPKAKSINLLATTINLSAIVRWHVENCPPMKPGEILRDIGQDKIPDIILSKISIVKPWTQYNQYTLKNENFPKEWVFKPYTFRKGTWDRLKATDFPAKKLYERYRYLKQLVCEGLDDKSKRRWRDTILMNAPHPELTNDEIKSIWCGTKFAMLQKERRGDFELMDIGEF